MSYILEALRRAERERHPAQTPEVRIIADAHGARIALQRPTWPWVAGGVALAFVLGALLVALLLRSRTPDTPSPAAPAASLPASAPALADASTPYPSNPQRLDDLVDPEAGLSELPPEDEIYSEAELLEEAAPRRVNPSSAAARAPAPVAAVEPDVAYRSESREVVLEAAPEPQIPALKDMPADYRAEFPSLSLDVHFYDDDLARRFAMLNGRRYRQGDTLQEGPQLVEITPDGLVLGHRGRQVFLPAQH